MAINSCVFQTLSRPHLVEMNITGISLRGDGNLQQNTPDIELPNQIEYLSQIAVDVGAFPFNPQNLLFPLTNFSYLCYRLVAL